MSLDESSLIRLDCIGDAVLRDLLEGEAPDAKETCSHCGELGRCVSLGKLADFVHEKYQELFTPGEEVPVFDADSDKPRYEQAGDSPSALIQEMTDADDEVCEALEAILSEREEVDVRDGADALFDSGAQYELRSMEPWELRYVWENFCLRLKHERRFLGDDAKIALGQIFAALETAKESESVSPIVELEPGRKIYRGRTARSEKEGAEIGREAPSRLGPPPIHSCPGGRMNPPGIPIFYGAFSRETCIAEVRASVGAFVVTAEFEATAKLRLLDLSVFDSPPPGGSLFRPGLYDEVAGWLFMRELERMLRQPVQPHDEAIEYVPTQAVAEYVHKVLEFDGLVYAPAQLALPDDPDADLMSLKNVALFHGNGIVDTGIEKQPEPPKEDGGLFGTWHPTDFSPELEARSPALRLVPGSVEFVQVRGVRVDTERTWIFLDNESEPDF